MVFDANAYAEGICNSAAGSSIEVFVMSLDYVIGTMEGKAEDMSDSEHYEDDDRHAHAEQIDRWKMLRKEIVEREPDLSFAS